MGKYNPFLFKLLLLLYVYIKIKRQCTRLVITYFINSTPSLTEIESAGGVQEDTAATTQGYSVRQAFRQPLSDQMQGTNDGSAPRKLPSSSTITILRILCMSYVDSTTKTICIRADRGILPDEG